MIALDDLRTEEGRRRFGQLLRRLANTPHARLSGAELEVCQAILDGPDTTFFFRAIGRATEILQNHSTDFWPRPRRTRR